MGSPGNNSAVLTLCPLRQCQIRAALEGIWRVAFPPEISSGESVVLALSHFCWNMPIRFIPMFPEDFVDLA